MEEIKTTQGTNKNYEDNSVGSYVEQVNNDIEDIKRKIQENLNRLDEILKKMAEMLGVDFNIFKEKTKGYPGTKFPSLYGYKNFEDEEKANIYIDLGRETDEIFRQNKYDFETKISELNTKTEIAKEGSTKEGKEDLIRKLEDPANRENLLHYIDALVDSGIISESEIVEILNKLLDNTFSIYRSGKDKEIYKGPHGDTAEYQSQLLLQNLPQTLLEKLKNSPLASSRLKKAFEFDLLSK